MNHILKLKRKATLFKKNLCMNKRSLNRDYAKINAHIRDVGLI